jgi:hypothetical protein
MDIGSTTEITEKQGSTFISHVFNFDEGTKDTLLNLMGEGRLKKYIEKYIKLIKKDKELRFWVKELNMY